MKSFFLKVTLLFALLLGAYLFLLHRLVLGPVDGYYYKFTQEAEGIILGLSRANTGITPHILNKELSAVTKYVPTTNFAFEKFQSPYGEVYLNAIKKKLSIQKERSLSILCVTPGSLTAPKGMDSNAIFKMDKKSMLGKVSDYTSNPNYDYIIHCYGQSLYNALITSKEDNQTTLHTDGWREFKLKSNLYEVTQEDIEYGKSFTLENHKNANETEKKSPYRINNLIATIAFLKTKSDVFLVRMPADSDIIELENQQWVNFDRTMDSIAQVKGITYLNYTLPSYSFSTYDGSHMHSSSAKAFTVVLAKDISHNLSFAPNPNSHIDND
ncbi:hypothetical protein LV716_18015 [Flagellimonas sp. HMM57]|uniref:hypothetical protein n=1 Tax=unclassified Flagellimonas TaxID=2644544 RepID=UPI0013D3683D|nr:MULTISPECIES: hypothetical protein [unclassified Flagellimonas]UII76138.1 hypothetical protein LV716_18015 [Flagellimonas sp. HMM57]